jgi:predicted nucleic acid-binding protein
MRKHSRLGWKNRMSDILVDTGFLLGLYDHRDQYHEKAKECFSLYFSRGANKLVICWPVLYEAVSTRLVKNRPGMRVMQADWLRLTAQRRLQLLSDLPFRERILDECFDELGKPAGRARSLSLVDRGSASSFGCPGAC